MCFCTTEIVTLCEIERPSSSERAFRRNPMTRSILTAIVLCIFAAACQTTNSRTSTTAAGTWSTYGEHPMGPGDAVAIGALAGGEKDVVVHGVITDVCKVKGCWMT